MITVCLGYSRIAIRNQNGRYAWVPSWTFTGEIINPEQDGSHVITDNEEMYNDVILVLNALNATVIYAA